MTPRSIYVNYLQLLAYEPVIQFAPECTWKYLEALGRVDPTGHAGAAAALLTMTPAIAVVARHQLQTNGQVNDEICSIAGWIAKRASEVASLYSNHAYEEGETIMEQDDPIRVSWH